MKKATIAIDIGVGEADELGKGYRTKMMKLALFRCFSDPSVTAVLIDPLASTQRFYERLGSHFVERSRFGDDHCMVYRLNRTDWNRRASPLWQQEISSDTFHASILVSLH